MSKLKLIPDWNKKNLTCRICGKTQSVKYEVKLITAKNYLDGEKVCVCNKCALIYSTNFVEH